MKLVYTATGKPVAIGDTVTVSGHQFVIGMMPKPHKPDSEGRVYMHVPGSDDRVNMTQLYVSVIGAEWIEREDRMSAVDRGAADFFAGRHLNPFTHNTDSFRNWITGYRAAKDTEAGRSAL